MNKNAIPIYAWFVPLVPLALAFLIFFGEIQSSSFLYINQLTQQLPDTLWAWLTFFGNGWGVFALAFPLLLLAPRMLSAGVFSGALAGLISTPLKAFFNLPRPGGVLLESSFYRIGDLLLHKALPSGHTLTAFAVATGLYFSVNQDKRKPLFILFFLAALVGLSRNAIGAHWLTDALAGAGLGIWCGMLGALIANLLPQTALEPNKIWPRLIAIGGIVSIYAHVTQIMDLELNQPLQYASIAVLATTLIFFGKAQFSKSRSL